MGAVTAEEVCSQCILLLGAGHITTMDQLGNTALALLRDPEQLGRLRDNPALVRSATDEGLRYDGSVQLLQRVAREDLRLGGKATGEGELIYLSLGAANRDPEVFAEPDRFDVSRADNRHLAFGAGPHACLGMTLARRELEIALGRLVRRMPRLRSTRSGRCGGGRTAWYSVGCSRCRFALTDHHGRGATPSRLAAPRSHVSVRHEWASTASRRGRVPGHRPSPAVAFTSSSEPDLPDADRGVAGLVQSPVAPLAGGPHYLPTSGSILSRSPQHASV